MIFSNGDDWRAQRKLFVSTVKSSGFGRAAIEQAVDLFWPKMRAVVASQPDEEGYLSPRAFDRALTEFIVFVFADPGSLPGNYCTSTIHPL